MKMRTGPSSCFSLARLCHAGSLRLDAVEGAKSSCGTNATITATHIVPMMLPVHKRTLE